MLVVLSLTAILSSLAYPSMHHLLQTLYLQMNARQLAQTLEFARSEAIHRHRTVTLCGSEDGLSCSPSWSKGWIVALANNDSGLVPQILYQYRNSQPVTLRFEVFGSHYQEKRVLFGPLGEARHHGSFLFYRGLDAAHPELALVLSPGGHYHFSKSSSPLAF